MREGGGERWEVDKREKWNEGGRNRNRGDRGKEGVWRGDEREIEELIGKEEHKGECRNEK